MTETYFEEAHSKQEIDLLNIIFDQNQKALLNIQKELLSLKQDEMNLIKAEFDPQYKFLEEKRNAGLIS